MKGQNMGRERGRSRRALLHALVLSGRTGGHQSHAGQPAQEGAQRGQSLSDSGR